MSTPFYQPEDSADEQGHNLNPQWTQTPGPAGWGGAPNPHQAPQSYQQNYQVTPPAFAQQYQQYQQQPQQRSMVLAAVLAFFLGVWGVHNFYLGYTRAGVAQLALNVTGWVLSFVLIGIPLLFVVGVWAFIEFILILMRSGRFSVDSQGVPLQ